MALTHGPVCPLVPEHGALNPPKDNKSRFYCAHQSHDGRPSTHPLGAAPQTAAFFTRAEAESGIVKGPLAKPVELVAAVA